MRTDRTLDAMTTGNSWFAVQGADGNELAQHTAQLHFAEMRADAKSAEFVVTVLVDQIGRAHV